MSRPVESRQSRPYQEPVFYTFCRSAIAQHRRYTAPVPLTHSCTIADTYAATRYPVEPRGSIHREITMGKFRVAILASLVTAVACSRQRPPNQLPSDKVDGEYRGRTKATPRLISSLQIPETTAHEVHTFCRKECAWCVVMCENYGMVMVGASPQTANRDCCCR